MRQICLLSIQQFYNYLSLTEEMYPSDIFEISNIVMPLGNSFHELSAKWSCCLLMCICETEWDVILLNNI